MVHNLNRGTASVYETEIFDLLDMDTATANDIAEGRERSIPHRVSV